MVLVDRQRADAFDRLAGAPGRRWKQWRTMSRSMRRSSASPMPRARRTCSSVTCSISGERLRSMAAVCCAQSRPAGLQRRHDLAHAAAARKSGRSRRADAGQFAGEPAGDPLQACAQPLDAFAVARRPTAAGRSADGRHAVGQAAPPTASAAPISCARQGQVLADAPGAAREELAAAHVGEQADVGLGHGHLGALGARCAARRPGRCPCRRP